MNPPIITKSGPDGPTRKAWEKFQGDCGRCEAEAEAIARVIRQEHRIQSDSAIIGVCARFTTVSGKSQYVAGARFKCRGARLRLGSIESNES
jgi:hypothetical protein